MSFRDAQIGKNSRIYTYFVVDGQEFSYCSYCSSSGIFWNALGSGEAFSDTENQTKTILNGYLSVFEET